MIVFAGGAVDFGGCGIKGREGRCHSSPCPPWGRYLKQKSPISCERKSSRDKLCRGEPAEWEMGLFGYVGVEEVFGVGAVEFVLCGDASVGIEIECEGRAGVGVIPLVGCVEVLASFAEEAAFNEPAACADAFGCDGMASAHVEC